MSDEEQARDAEEARPSDPPRRPRRWRRRALSVLGGIVVGLVVAEGAFWLRDDGAFPHVNFYQPDAELGARLRPGATMRFRFQDNPTTDIAVNAQGYRGPDWPAQVEGAVLVVGDSQVFGLGVNDDETMAAQLAELTGRTVLNGGVPTYGPGEYEAVVREQLASHPEGITTVVYVVNMANDFFEDTRPNTERHVIWDGWAVRAELAPERITDFPGRELLFRRSHAFYALRRHLSDDTPRPTELASEGTWHDLVGLVGDDERPRDGSDEEDATQPDHASEVRRQRLRLEQSARDADDAVDERLRPAEVAELGDRDRFYLDVDVARGHPGDIVGESAAEESREIAVTASLIRRAVRHRAALIEARREEDPVLRRALEAQEQVHAERERLRALAFTRPDTRVPSSLEPRIARVKALCDEHGAELVVVALPLDVVVSSDEWAKYGAEPVDMEPTRVLLQDLVGSAHHLGARAFDATDALRAAQPGAFLDGDLHMTAKGQRALAEAVARELSAPPPLRLPAAGLPEGRSHLPTTAEWVSTPEITVRGSSAARCETVQVREWLRVTCLRHGRSRPTAIEPAADDHEALVLVTDHAADYVVPLAAGRDVTTEFHWNDRSQTLTVRWEGGAPVMALSEPRAAEIPERRADTRADRLCACHIEVVGERQCRNHMEQYSEWTECGEGTCQHAFGALTEACFDAYEDDCAALLHCVQADGLAPPPCPDGQVLAGATGQCFVPCDPAHPCAEGTCVEWNGGGLCREVVGLPFGADP